MASQSYDKIEGVIWYDGKLVKWADANVHVLTHGLHYASCVFEGDLRLKLNIGPITITEGQPEEFLRASFNYHADVTDGDHLLKVLALWEKARAHSELIARDLDDRVVQCQ